MTKVQSLSFPKSLRYHISQDNQSFQGKLVSLKKQSLKIHSEQSLPNSLLASNLILLKIFQLDNKETIELKRAT